MNANDSERLDPTTTFDAPTLEFDFPGIEVGVAEYETGPTGCTVFSFSDTLETAVDVRGGAPGTIGGYGTNDAICFAGGSLYGLEATTGVTAELLATGGYTTEWEELPTVSGAIIYDFDRETSVYPDKQLGRAALRAAEPGRFPLGGRGAGRSATCGWFESEPAGQGGSFRQIDDIKIAAFVVVNSAGVVLNHEGTIVKGAPETRSWQSFTDSIEADIRGGGEGTDVSEGTNTTLSLVVTNLVLSNEALGQLGKQIHTSMARAIQPFHTATDGDVLYAVTTNEVERSTIAGSSLGVLASEVVWDAVLSAVEPPDRA